MLDQNQRSHRCVARLWAPSAFLLLSLGCASSVQAAPHFVTFVNDSDRTVTSIEAAPVGTHRWRALDLGGPLIGGRSGQAAVRFDDGEACKEDLSVSYRGMAPVTITGFNVCRMDRLYLGRVLARAMFRTPTIDKGKMTPAG